MERGDHAEREPKRAKVDARQDTPAPAPASSENLCVTDCASHSSLVPTFDFMIMRFHPSRLHPQSHHRRHHGRRRHCH